MRAPALRDVSDQLTMSTAKSRRDAGATKGESCNRSAPPP